MNNFAWIDKRFRPPSGKPDPQRAELVAIAGVALGAILIAGFFALMIAIMSSDWDGSTISITNSCGYDLYASDAWDGIVIKNGETIRWSRASEELEKTIRVRRLSSLATRSEGLLVELHGDSVLEGQRCPSVIEFPSPS